LIHPVENITTKRGQTFRIVLKSNPTSGYRWLPTFDKSIINLISHDFQPFSPSGIGQSGEDVFIFRAVNRGSDNLRIAYKRGWEKRSVAERIFVINVE
jgi:predicted secreted protein